MVADVEDEQQQFKHSVQLLKATHDQLSELYNTYSELERLLPLIMQKVLGSLVMERMLAAQSFVCWRKEGMEAMLPLCVAGSWRASKGKRSGLPRCAHASRDPGH